MTGRDEPEEPEDDDEEFNYRVYYKRDEIQQTKIKQEAD